MTTGKGLSAGGAGGASSRWTRALASRSVVAVLLFLLVNLAVAGFMVRPQAAASPESLLADALARAKERSFSWWTASAYLDRPAAPDIALIGSSQVGTATFTADAELLGRPMDVLVHRQASTFEADLKRELGRPLTVFNFSQGGFMVSDAYMLSRALFSGPRLPKLAIIGVAPRDFMDNSMASPAETEPFRFYSRAVGLGELSGQAFGDPFAYLQWLLRNRLPLCWVQEELERRWQDTTPARHHKRYQNVQAIFDITGDLQPGTMLVPANIRGLWMDNTIEYRHRYRLPDPPVYRQELVFFDRLLGYLDGRGIKVLVVGMPSLPSNRALLPESFWASFHEKMAGACARHHAGWLDYSASPVFTRQDYLDTVHLNARGGARFFTMLAKAIKADAGLAGRLEDDPARRQTLAGARPAPRI